MFIPDAATFNSRASALVHSKAIKDARHVQPAAPGPVAGVVDRRMPDARVAGTIMGI
jgi:hypothetical protein